MIREGIEWSGLWANYSTEYGIFLALVVGALVLGATPLGKPLKWAETFYHEFSHGMAALLTLGRPVRLQLKWGGAGTCWTTGGSRIVILLAGYVGAAAWGAALYLIGWALAHPMIAWWAGFDAAVWLRVELIIMLVALVWLVRDIVTLIIMLLMMAVYAGALWFPLGDVLPWILQFMGIYVLLNAIRAPLHLIDGQHVGDGAALAEILYIPEFIWVLVWFLFALGMLGLCAYLTLPGIASLLG